MKYPKLREIPMGREFVDVFKGYNHNLRIGSGEFYDMTNLSSDNYPVLSTRQPRGICVTNPENLAMQGMIVSQDSLCYVKDDDFVINGYHVPMGLSEDTEPKTLIAMGSYVIIMPDKKYVNTTKNADGEYDWDTVDAIVKTTGEVTFQLCNSDGLAYQNYDKQDEPPSNPRNSKLWIDTSVTPNQLKRYSSATATWNTITPTYIKITHEDLGTKFYANDVVRISGVEVDGLYNLESSDTTIHARGENFIVVNGFVSGQETQAQPLTVERRMPDMDFVVESDNRLWGCKYGKASNGEFVNEIYASKLGDFKNWNCFNGISTDSYVASVGTDGPFTGAITHLGYPLFFKENCVHKVYGNYPANYQIQTTACRGVQKGCSKSLAIVNEILYYKARSAVCAYDGSLPVEISSSLGEMSYRSAVAGFLGNKYYISMMDELNKYHLFVYDTTKGMWHREDDTQAKDFCNCRGYLYYIDYGDNTIKMVKDSGNINVSISDPTPIKWSAVTGIIGTDSPDKKYISRLDVRMSLDVNTRVMFFIEYDSSGEWEHLFTMTGTNLGSFSVPIRPKRCDHMRIKIIGTGNAKVFSICKTIEQGSDI
jgi:hypothetical protein